MGNRREDSTVRHRRHLKLTSSQTNQKSDAYRYGTSQKITEAVSYSSIFIFVLRLIFSVRKKPEDLVDDSLGNFKMKSDEARI